MRSGARQDGIALIIVVVVLVALAVIATPFALSMRGLEASALLGFEREVARGDAAVALSAARAQLEETHPFLDRATPFSDGTAEIAPSDLAARHPERLPRDPRGVIASVDVDDLSGRVHLGSASPWLLGNLLGGRGVLVEDVDERSAALRVAGAAGFPPAGLAWVGRELVEYSRRTTDELGECRRGFPSANLSGSRALPHRAGSEVLDLRLLLLAQHGYRARPGIFDVFRRVDGLKEIALYGEQAYSAETLERVRPLLTVHGGAPRWRPAQRVRERLTGRDGGVELRVPDGRSFGAGTIVRLSDAAGRHEYNLSLGSVEWPDGWRVALLEPPAGTYGPDEASLAALERQPVNILTCGPVVLEALLAGLARAPIAGVIDETEAAALAAGLIAADLGLSEDALQAARAQLVGQGRLGVAEWDAALAHVQRERLRPGQIDAAGLQRELAGLPLLQPRQAISSTTAQLVASRLREEAPTSFEELAQSLLAAVAAGELDPVQRQTILRNAIDSSDARLAGGTAPFAFSSAGLFELRAAASRNQPNGRQSSAAHVRQIVSVAPSGESAHGFSAQIDFAAAAARSSGWTSEPVLLESGPGPALPGEAGAGDLGQAHALGAVPPDRAASLEAGRPGAGRRPEVDSFTPATVRSALPGTLHFDEGAFGLTGASPRGASSNDAPVLLPRTAIAPAIAGSEGRLGVFAVEFWFELADVQAETILFDGGLDEIENRVLIAMQGGELLLRVDDTGIPDFEATMPEGRAPPAGEIRYAFDDGLALLPGVPYHVLAEIGGASDARLALWVDGVPRGRRSFTTALSEDVPARGGGLPGVAGGGELRLKVESTAGFPRQGALRVGEEIIEYVDRTETEFLVRGAADGDPFGGRGRRRSVRQEHPASELVELHGWVAPLASRPAARGNAQLASTLARFTVAELDPAALTDPILAEVQPVGSAVAVEIPLGTGLTADATSIPLRAAGGAALESDSFQSSGGWAIVFCDYGRTRVSGAAIPGPNDPNSSVTLPATTTGGWLGGAEVVRYTGFDGQRLTGVQRAQAGIPVASGGSASDLSNTGAPPSVQGGDTAWSSAREYVTTFDAALVDALSLPETARVLVFPISIGVNGGTLFQDFHPAAEGGLPQRASLLQIGLDFTPGDDGTEWVRWDTATASGFVRDDSDAVGDTLEFIIAQGWWDPDATAFGAADVDAINGELRFRGQAETRDAGHRGDLRVLPVHVFAGWQIDAFRAQTGLPGRHDALTLVDPEGDREWHRVNWATTNDDLWGPGFALLGLRGPVVGEYFASPQDEEDSYALEDLDLDRYFEGDSSARRIVESFNIDTRKLVRAVCSPSGELPSGALPAFRLGADFNERPSPGAVLVDELRFHAPAVPGPLLPDTSRYVLAEDLEYEEQRQLVLYVDLLAGVHNVQRNAVLGKDALEILGELPQAGGLLRIGEEIVGYAGIDPVDSGAVFLTARGLYGSRRAFHRRGEAVTPLLAWPAAPLAGRVDDRSPVLPLADAGGFPPRGLVLVGEELVGYDDASGGALSMPARRGSTLLQRDGLLRGRFGTRPTEHEAGTIVRWMPERHRDAALLGDDVPESQSGRLLVRAPGALLTDAVVEAFLPDPAVGLALRFVFDGEVSPHADPGATARRPLAAGDAGGEPLQRIVVPLRRAADELELALFAVWRAGAFDPRTYAASGWKLAPVVDAVTIGHVQPTLVLEHEEGP